LHPLAPQRSRETLFQFQYVITAFLSKVVTRFRSDTASSPCRVGLKKAVWPDGARKDDRGSEIPRRRGVEERKVMKRVST